MKILFLIIALGFCQISYSQKQNLPQYIYYYKSGDIASEYFFRGYTDNFKSHWFVREFYRNGSLRKEYECIDDTNRIIFNSVIYLYYKNGQLSSKFIQPQKSYYGAYDFYQGYSISYFKSGIIEKEGLSILGRGNFGLWKYYYPDGTIKMRGFWRGFRRIGYWEYFDETGKLIKWKNYD